MSTLWIPDGVWRQRGTVFVPARRGRRAAGRPCLSQDALALFYRVNDILFVEREVFDLSIWPMNREPIVSSRVS